MSGLMKRSYRRNHSGFFKGPQGCERGTVHTIMDGDSATAPSVRVHPFTQWRHKRNLANTQGGAKRARRESRDAEFLTTSLLFAFLREMIQIRDEIRLDMIRDDT